jgi:hypothetical protein
MSGSILKFAKPKTPVEEIREDVIRLLKKTLAEAKRGEIDEILILARGIPVEDDEGADSGWVERASPTLHFRDWIGALRLMEDTMIRDYVEHVRYSVPIADEPGTEDEE